MEPLIPIERVEKRILFFRGQKVMLDSDLAELYNVATKNLNKAVARNMSRFPEDFMFQLSRSEYDSLRFQFGTLKKGQHSKYLPRVFTEQGVAMLSSVLRSQRAIHVNIAIMRAFVNLRRMIASHKGLARRLNALEQKYDGQFAEVFERIRELMDESDEPKRRIGFQP